jgi:hypothetical protein
VSIDFGCLSVDTIAANDKYIAWLGVNETNGPIIMVYSGQGAEQISTDGIAYLMGSIKFPAQSAATFLREDGHIFYQLTFFNPADNISFRYDFNTKKFFHVTDEHQNYFPAAEIVYFNNTNYFISLNDGFLYETSTDLTNYSYNFYEEEFIDWRYVHTIPRIRICETLRSPRTSRFRSNAFIITLEQGTDNGPAFDDCQIIMIHEDGTRIVSENGIQVVPENDIYGPCIPSLFNKPRVDLSLSYDGCETWSNDVSRYMNPIGYRKNIIMWNQLGQANEITPKLHFWSTGRIVVKDGVMDIY